MSLYDLIYNFVINNIWTNTELSTYLVNVGNNEITMNIWLSHTTTIISMALLLIALILFIKSMFMLFGRLFKLR